MFGGKINFRVTLHPQHFYNISYAKRCYWWVKKNNISIWTKLESITTYNIRFVVKLL